MRFVPLDDNITSASFELNNALNVSRVVDDKGKQIPASRNQQDFTVRLSFEQPLAKGQPVTITFYYDGRLTGQEDSPVYGIKFAAIHPDFAYLMYPARWFPVSGYTTDRFAADLRVTVPDGLHGARQRPGFATRRPATRTVYEFKFERPSFPGSIAVVKGAAGRRSQSEGVTTTLYFRGPEADMAQPYGEEIGKIDVVLHGPVRPAALRQSDGGGDRRRRAQRLCRAGHDLSGAARHRQGRPNAKLLANQISRQWWEELVSPATRNHLWLTNGLAAYSELLWTEHENGPGAMEAQLRDVMVESLTIDNVPIIQAARLEDYSPELWALTGGKGAAVMNMLRYVMGDEKFFKTLKEYAQQDAWKIAPPPTISGRSPRTCAGRIWATSSSSGSNPAARRNSSWNTRFSARRRVSA